MRSQLPHILQAQTAECGIACLAMIAGYHGFTVDLTTLRKRLTATQRGASVAHIIRDAGKLNLAARAIRLEPDELGALQLPAVLHWNFNHFVVLSRVTRSGVIVSDPAVGIRRYNFAELAQRFTGIAVEFTPMSSFTPGDDRHALRLLDLFRTTPAITSALLQLLLLSFVIQALALTTPFYVQTVVDQTLGNHDADLLLILALGFAAIAVLSTVTRHVRALIGLFLSARLNFVAASALFGHLIRLPLPYFRQRHLGDIVSRFESLKPLQDFLSQSTVTVLIDGLLAISTLILMAVYSTSLCAVAIVSAIVYGIFRYCQYTTLRKRTLESIATSAELSSAFMETIRNISAVKLAAEESGREHRWRNLLARANNRELVIGRLGTHYDAASHLLSGLEHVLIIYLGATEVMAGELSIGMMYAFMAYRSHFSSGVTSLINQALGYQMLGLHLERIADIVNEPVEIEADHWLTLPLSGNLTARHVTFAYEDGSPILANINLLVPAGTSLAISGPSGTGKTTLLELLQGLRTPTEGSIAVDNIPMSPVLLGSLREASATVSQQDQLFSGSLQDNITFFASLTDTEKLHAACRDACILETIESLPMQFETQIGDMGAALSGGQVQRILLARALYREPRMLFLDEGTAHIDPATECLVFERLRARGMTLVFVSHNPALDRFADQVLRLGDTQPVVEAESATGSSGR